MVYHYIIYFLETGATKIWSVESIQIILSVFYQSSLPLMQCIIIQSELVKLFLFFLNKTLV